MSPKTPMTIITGSLGSGKTTLLQYILKNIDRKIAILMNEFGEIAIDSKIIKGKNVDIAELEGGCVCCSLIGEFEAAVDEIIETVKPDVIVLETTGVAEPDALIFDIEESLPQVRLDGVVTIVDADLMMRFPQLGKTTHMQIEDGDILLLNKMDLVDDPSKLIENLRQINKTASIILTEYCQVDPEILFGISRRQQLGKKPTQHSHEFQSFSYQQDIELNRQAFEDFVEKLDPHQIIRSKGFVRFQDQCYLFNYVSGRWNLEPSEKEKTALVFIGREMSQDVILRNLERCKS